MKKLISLTLSILMLLSCLVLASCGNSKKTIADKVAAGGTVKIGINQLMPNPSLDN